MKYETILQQMCTIKHIAPSPSYNIMVNLNKTLFDKLLVLMYAFSQCSSRPLNFFVLHSDFEKKQIETLQKYGDSLGILTKIIYIDPKEFAVFGSHRLPNETFYYYKVGEVIPEGIDRILHIDIDTLPLKDIAPFYDTDFESSWLVATNEYNSPFFNRYFKDQINGHFTAKPFYSSEIIYNAGVLLMNVAKFRENKISISHFANLAKKQDFITGVPDQVIINRFTRTDIKLFPKPYFNCWVAHDISSAKAFDNLNKVNEVYGYFQKDPELLYTIIHFTAFPSIKPWRALNSIRNGTLGFVKLAPSIEKYCRIWWDMAKNIPIESYGELVASSIKFNDEKLLNAEKRNNHLKDFYPGYANIACLGSATQSSISEYSQAKDEAKFALTGKLKDGEDYAFHTEREDVAWWMVDLKDYYKLRMVKLFKRDRDRQRYRADTIEILFSTDSISWVDLGRPKDNADDDTYELLLPALIFRFVKVQVRNTWLHFKRIGIYI